MNVFISILNKQTVKLLLILLFFITIPLKNSYNSISILFLIVYSIINYRKIDFKDFKEFYPMIILYLLMGISLFYSENLRNGFEYLILAIPLIAFPFVFSTIKLTINELRFVFKYYIFWLSILILFSEIVNVLNIISNNESLFLIFRKDYSYINLGEIIGVHPPYMVLLMSFSVFYMISHFERTQINKTLQVIILILFLFYIIHLSARLPLACIILISFFLVFKKIKAKYTLLKSAFVLLLMLIITSFALYNIRSTRYRFIELIGMQYSNGVYIKSAPLKVNQWSAGINANHNILLGNGVGDANESIIESNYKKGLVKNAELKYNAHNQFIQTYVGLGVLGLLSLIYLLIYFLLIKSNPLFKTSTAAFFIYLLIVFLTESYLQRHHGLVFITFMLCLINERVFSKD